MKSLKQVAVIAAAGCASLALVGCSAGQITQTSNQVAAVDGASAATENGEVAVQDVTVVLAEDGKAALKFTATNQDTSMTDHTLKSVTAGGNTVKIANNNTIKYNCVLVADSAAGLERLPQDDANCISYTATSLANDDFAYGGNVPVTFNFDTGSIDVVATVSAPHLVSGQVDRETGAKH
ncbi:hypothetical protein HMPREF2690_07750 [Corynebacterium sp. HMSC034E11]|uniref:hypothetical protein n=1 Tax=Corynebacterium sp. HMSC034E11 TaxID=1715169 RepID=UPI0008A8B8E9|nr:hypothetical protein [Corynebacterium sp. HMSC034E11]OHO33279.1 hypothetical protein HMPREF2690_07750 [Corynebacterium sp. HMSC034E11]